MFSQHSVVDVLKETCVNHNFDLFSFAGFHLEQIRQGSLQTQHHQLLSTDKCQPDTEHHHVQAR